MRILLSEITLEILTVGNWRGKRFRLVRDRLEVWAMLLFSSLWLL